MATRVRSYIYRIYTYLQSWRISSVYYIPNPLRTT